MSDESDGIAAATTKNQEQGTRLMEKLLAVAQPGSVFSEPTTSGDHVVISASEVSVAMGFGFGSGGGTNPRPAEGGGGGEESPSQGFGGGGGGGGLSSGRPVAVISIGPDGVRIKSVIDITKIALAALTTVVAMLMMLRKMRG